jgi:hypothetical protein
VYKDTTDRLIHNTTQYLWIMNRILERSGMEEQIRDFLLHFNDERDDKQYKRGTYVYGSGIGKTRFVESILDDMGLRHS